jgi:hypothetical protein
MDSVVLLPSVALGLLFLFAYLYLCLRRKEKMNIGVMINAFLQSSGIVCGLLLMVGSVYAPAKEYLKGIDIYIFIAGLAVLVVSIQGVHKDIFSKSEKN